MKTFRIRTAHNIDDIVQAESFMTQKDEVAFYVGQRVIAVYRAWICVEEKQG